MKRGSQYLLRDVLGIQPGEGTLVALMFLLSFFIGIAKVVLQTTGGALFLTQYSKEFIPFLYVISALIVSSIGFAYAKLAQGYRLRSLLMLNLAFMLGSVLFYRVLLWGVPAAWPSLLVAVWYDVIKLLTSLAFWGLAERLFDIRQAKRLYGLIGSGEIFAAIWVGLSVPAIVAWIGTANLLWIVTIALVLCIALSILILRGHRSNEKQNLSDTHSSFAKQEKSSGQGMRALFNNRYVLLIFAIIALSYAGYYLVVNMFYVQSAERFPDADELAVFLSKFWALTGVITFFSRTLLTGPVLRRGGLTLGLLILPISVCAGTILVLTIQWSMTSVALVFWMVAMTRMLEKVFRDSIDKSAGLILYKPLSPKLRIQAQSTVEGIIGPFAGGLIGLGLLFLSQFAFFDLSSMAIMTFINAVLWIAIGLMIPKRYISMLTQALAKRRLNILVDFSIQEKSVINVIRRGLYSP
ncbi:hypothetical protein GF373_02045, partial [bacterium]|nr:hypothetical protein [bacterium]